MSYRSYRTEQGTHSYCQACWILTNIDNEMLTMLDKLRIGNPKAVLLVNGGWYIQVLRRDNG